MRTKSSLLFLLLSASVAQAQVALNTTGANPDNSAMLDVSSTTKGMLVPRMTTTERTGIPTPATGLLVYDTDLKLFHYYNGTAWTSLTTPTSAWSLAGNSGTTAGTNFLGTTDSKTLDIRTNNVIHHRIGTKGNIEVLGTGNSVFIGEGAGLNEDLTTRANVGIGYNALSTITTGANSVAIGTQALQSSTGSYNTAVGYQALMANTTATFNSALGYNALLNNVSGIQNTALGALALSGNTDGYGNAAVGYNALAANTTGSYNIAIGANTLTANTTGGNNIGIGTDALATNTTGTNNTAIGYQADVTSGGLSNATAIGNQAKVSASNCLVLGGTGTYAANVGIALANPVSTLDVNGSLGLKVKSGQIAGTNNPDASGTIWFYGSGTGTITLPNASTSTNRMYTIINQTGATRTISAFLDVAGASQTTIATATSITIVSNGTSWQRIM